MFKAYTLLEILIVLSLLTTTLLLAEPCFRHLFEQKDSDVVVQHLINLIQFARSEAIKRNRNISICPSKDSKHCASDWGEGQIIIDKKTNEILGSYPSLPKNSFLTWRNSFGRNNELIFTGEGFADKLKGSFLYQNRNGQKIVIAIEKTGRWRIIESNSEGIIEYSRNRLNEGT